MFLGQSRTYQDLPLKAPEDHWLQNLMSFPSKASPSLPKNHLAKPGLTVQRKETDGTQMEPVSSLDSPWAQELMLQRY